MLKYVKSENSNTNKHFNNPKPLCTQMHAPGPHQLALITNLTSSKPNHKSSLHFEDTWRSLSKHVIAQNAYLELILWK